MSRRLGRSVGVNVVPFKTCTYSCIYCQLGPTDKLTTRRLRFYEEKDIAIEVADTIDRAHGKVDAVTVIGEGEPTLAANLGRVAEALRSIWPGRLALISNGSLFFVKSVRKDASRFDVVSVNVSAADERTFSRLHRPAKGLTLKLVNEGLREFSSRYEGELWTETMLVQGVNDDPAQLRSIRDEISRLAPARSFLAVPTRPPTLSWARPPTEDAYRAALGILDFAEDIHRPEGEFPRVEGEAVTRLLRISEMHPLREDQAVDILREGRAESCARSCLSDLVERGELKVRTYHDVRYYSRVLP